MLARYACSPPLTTPASSRWKSSARIMPRALPAKGSSPAEQDPTGSFIDQSTVTPLNTSGPLKGLALAVKDLFDVAGQPTGFGHPLWRETRPVPTSHAAVVQALLDAGATSVGKTHLDELAYSLMGENFHYGTPLNTAAPGRVPGGSSSGTAAAVAARQADIGLGSDTGGSVRVPASFCGLFGIRPTHGRLSLAGACPLAPSLDTVGWFARDAALLEKVGQVLLQHPTTEIAPPGRPPAAGMATPATTTSNGSGSAAAAAATPADQQQQQPFKPRWLVAKDAFEVAAPETSKAIYGALSGEVFPAVTALLGQPTELEIAAAEQLAAAGLQRLTDWPEVFRVVQACEIWRQHGAWVTEHKPEFGPGIKERFAMAAAITEEEWKAQDANRSLIAAHVHQLLGSDGVLAIPTTPGPAVPLAAPAEQVSSIRLGLLSLTCIAGLSGLPQVTLPVAEVDGMPVGVSLIGPRNSDEQLLALAAKLAAIVVPSKA